MRELSHGSAAGYGRGCRCEVCSEYQRRRMEKYHNENPRGRYRRNGKRVEHADRPVSAAVPNCLVCGTGMAGRTGTKYCSTRCNAIAGSRHAAESLKLRAPRTRTCPTCSKVFGIKGNKRKNKYCSKKCWSESRRESPKLCQRCGEPLKRRDPAYCRKCYRTRAQDAVAKWLAGESNGSGRTGHLLPSIKIHMRVSRNNKCDLCPFDAYHADGRSVHEIHHIDGDWKNNRVENLQYLCPTCHRLTPNYGFRNIGKGRFWKRRLRSAEDFEPMSSDPGGLSYKEAAVV